MVKKAIKIGTISTLNQIRASNINDITGVDLIVTKIGFKKALKVSFVPASIPNPTPNINEAAKPIIPRKTVKPIAGKNFSDKIILNVEIKVDSGDGKINSD
ncbi:MAG TPA: hypothetical protein P5132_04475 [Bacteroidales bacterium]|nr:hypothetical protein [Bacteroidales bacterium]